MAQYYNLVTNSNGTYSIEDVQICSIDGQRVQFVVEDIHNGANVQISQPIVAYATSPESTEQTIFSQPTINVGAQDANAQSEQRQSVYIIKSNDPPIQQTIYNKIDSENSRFQGDNSLKVNQGNWLSTRENNEQFELVIKKEPLPVKSFVPNTVRTQQQITTAQVSAPNVVLQAGPDKKTTRLVPLTKRNSLGGQPVGILRTTLQGVNPHTVKVGKMKRNSTAASNSTISLPVRSRASTGGINANLLTTPPRAPQARPPIHATASQRNSAPLSKNALSPNIPEMGHLSERIKQANLKQRQQNNEQRQLQKQQQPVVAVNSAQRSVQSAQGPVQRQRAMGQLLQRQQNPHQQQQQQQQQQLQLQMLQQQQQPQVAQQNRQIQAAVVDESAEQLMEVDSSDNMVQLERLNCTAKSDPEENSSESVAYLQQEISDPHTTIVQHQITGNEAKMLVILADGQQRLITFEVPKEDCTVQDLLEQANIYSTQDPHVSLVSDPTLGINYIVDVTPRTASLEEEQHVTTTTVETTTVVTNVVETKSPGKSNNSSPSTLTHPPPSKTAPKYVEGMLAVCPYCGMSAIDFNTCQRCKRRLPDDVKAIPICSGAPVKKDSTLPPETFYKKGESGVQKPERDAVSKRGRGRGRGVSRPKQVKEPECLTISSDEEDDNRKKRLGVNKDGSSPLSSTHCEESYRIIDKEPIITNDTCINSQNPTSSIKEENLPDPITSNLTTHLPCRTVRIGSYKYAPTDPVLISSAGLKLEVPLLEDDNSFITVDIGPNDLIKALLHFSKSMPVLFFYITPQSALRIRELLGMQDPIGPYFDPAGKDQTHRRITLLPDKILDEPKATLKEIYKHKHEELNAKEANDILVQASPKTKSTQQFITVQNSAKKQTCTTSSISASSNGVIQTITVYPPPPAKGGIAINTEDFICLGEDQFLNDVIIDFYLKYLTLEILSTTDHNRTHVFSSYFYKRLTSPHTQAAENTENLSAAAKRHARVQKWTKNVNIFEKDFIVIPINEHAHWFLAIICYPGLVGTVALKTEQKSTNEKVAEKKKKDVKAKNVRMIGETTITPVNTILLDTNDDGSERDEAEGDDEEMETDSDEEDEAESKADVDQAEKTNCQTPPVKEVNKVPCILIFDSLAGASRCRVVATLRDYLSCEYLAKMGSEKLFSKDTIKGACPRVPQQSNFTDCGLYVLQYVESFFKTPITDYTLPIKTLKTWFEEIIVTRKREEIAKLLTNLVNNTKGDKTINLPKLVFPTQDGQLKQKPEPEVEPKTAKAEAENKKKTLEAAEQKSTVACSTTQSPEINSDPSKSGVSQTTIPQPSNQTLCTTDGNLLEQKEAAAVTTTTTTTKSSTDTMAFLKNKRIPRLQKSSDNPEDKQVAKKHKGESFDSCK
ncbi:uncharacterized protein LOC100122748 isoform X2 [Nasonia vitripennis]|uniref:Ubiquitin-like protease family profile domain-containing protein n=2 Tax=Nasonia vitripennis TaxID=7425 RepID=A0A7M7H678_NASVI|nr:uncharacterized protein LOC100122748 isoform X2 [Nasonia vitripennis]